MEREEPLPTFDTVRSRGRTILGCCGGEDAGETDRDEIFEFVFEGPVCLVCGFVPNRSRKEGIIDLWGMISGVDLYDRVRVNGESWVLW